MTLGHHREEESFKKIYPNLCLVSYFGLRNVLFVSYQFFFGQVVSYQLVQKCVSY